MTHMGSQIDIYGKLHVGVSEESGPERHQIVNSGGSKLHSSFEVGGYAFIEGLDTALLIHEPMHRKE